MSVSWCQGSEVRRVLRECLAEFVGTAVLMVLGLGSVAQLVLSEARTGSSDQVRWSWGLGVTFGVYVAGPVSGAHLNPAVTLTLCLFGRVPYSRLVPFWVAQYLGSFTASGLVYAVYYDALQSYKDGEKTLETAAIFATYPQTYLSWVNGLGDQVFATALLMLLIQALCDPVTPDPVTPDPVTPGPVTPDPGPGYRPVLVGLVVVAIGMTYGHNCGYAINPARDLAPRLFTYLAGWGVQVFSTNNYQWFWVPVVGPHVGAVLGGATYELLIRGHLPCCGPARPAHTDLDTPHTDLEDSTRMTLIPREGGMTLESAT